MKLNCKYNSDCAHEVFLLSKTHAIICDRFPKIYRRLWKRSLRIDLCRTFSRCKLDLFLELNDRPRGEDFGFDPTSGWADSDELLRKYPLAEGKALSLSSGECFRVYSVRNTGKLLLQQSLEYFRNKEWKCKPDFKWSMNVCRYYYKIYRNFCDEISSISTSIENWIIRIHKFLINFGEISAFLIARYWNKMNAERGQTKNNKADGLKRMKNLNLQ